MNIFLSFLRSLLLAVACGSLAPGMAVAQPAGAQGDDFLYRTVAGDTLLGLAGRFTAVPGNWTVLQQINGVADPLRLPIGKTMRIPFALIPVEPAPARVSHIYGQVQVNGSALSVGQTLEEGALLGTEMQGFATLGLADGSMIIVPGDSKVRVLRMRAFKGTGLIDAIVSIEEGTIESVVAPEGKGVGRFEIRTPITVTGVRGTRLRVHSRDDVSRTELLEGTAHLGTSQNHQAQLKMGEGAVTDADGKLVGVRALMGTPQLEKPERGPQGWTVSFPPVPGAAGYIVRVAQDAEGTRFYSRERFSGPPVTFQAPGVGTYYVRVAAFDERELMGADGMQPFEGQPVLLSSDGGFVATAYGLQVQLMHD